jgi:hypothetical protein
VWESRPNHRHKSPTKSSANQRCDNVLWRDCLGIEPSGDGTRLPRGFEDLSGTINAKSCVKSTFSPVRAGFPIRFSLGLLGFNYNAGDATNQTSNHWRFLFAKKVSE